MKRRDFELNDGVRERALAITAAVLADDAQAFVSALYELTEWTHHCDKVVYLADRAVQDFFGYHGPDGTGLRCSVCEERASLVCFSCHVRFCADHIPHKAGEPPTVWSTSPDVVFLFQCPLCCEKEPDDADNLPSSHRAKSFVAEAFRHCSDY